MADESNNQEIDWIEEALAFDANSALIQSRIVWLKLAYQFRDVAGSFGDFLDRTNDADQAMAWAARAEACMWRATGDLNAIDVDAFLPDLLPTKDTPHAS